MQIKMSPEAEMVVWAEERERERDKERKGIQGDTDVCVLFSPLQFYFFALSPPWTVRSFLLLVIFPRTRKRGEELAHSLLFFSFVPLLNYTMVVLSVSFFSKTTNDKKRNFSRLFLSFLLLLLLLLLPPFPLPSHIFLAVPSSSVRLPCPKFNAVGGEERKGQEKGGGGGAEDQPGGDGSRRREGEKERKFFLPFLFHVLRASSTLFCQFDVFPWERATSCTNVAGVQHPVFQHGCCSLVSLPPFFKRVFYWHKRRRDGDLQRENRLSASSYMYYVLRKCLFTHDDEKTCEKFSLPRRSSKLSPPLPLLLDQACAPIF